LAGKITLQPTGSLLFTNSRYRNILRLGPTYTTQSRGPTHQLVFWLAGNG